MSKLDTRDIFDMGTAGDETDNDGTVKCPNGHTGPFRYVEHIAAWRWVRTIRADRLDVDGRYHTGEGYDDGEPGTAYLECHALDANGVDSCCAQFPLPREVDDFV